MNSQKYLAITLGPIYKTLQNVRKTRELWAASYTFSFISRRLIEKITKQHIEAVFVPYYQPDSPIGIGLYPDRIFLKAKDGLTIEKLKSFKSEVLKEVALWIDKDGKSESFLQQYFRIHIISFEAAANENPLLIGNNLLDTAELRSGWELEETKNELFHFFRGVNKLETQTGKWINEHFRQKDIFGQIRFESLTEIGTRTIREINKNVYKKLVADHCYTDNKEEKDDDAGFMKELQQLLNIKGKEEFFKNYHKYVCIVNADGDKVGKYIKAISENYEQNLDNLSKALYQWAVATAEKIKQYAGVPVYVGGDDILFLAPVVGNDNKTILQLAADLNELFINHFKQLPERKDENNQSIKPTLSFGISITYYKYPLAEALVKAGDLLYKAKETRNACSLSLLKHSGSSFDITLPNNGDDDITKAFRDVNGHFTSDKSFISSVIHHFRENEPVYSHIGTDLEKVNAYLLNNFEEDKHKDYVTAVAGLCHAVYNKNKVWKDKSGKAETASQKSVREIHSYLRILKFLNGLEDGK